MYIILLRFRSIRKIAKSDLLSSCLSVRTEQLGSHWWISIKFDIWEFFSENL